MASNRLQSRLAFILEIDKLKQVLRRNYVMDGSRHENTAEHSWHLTVAAWTLAEYANEPVDVMHVIKMLLVHDIVEIDAGDTFAYDKAAHLDKDDREQLAADRIFGLLPADQRDELRSLWDEFEALATPEAQFARAVDIFMPMFHNCNTEGKGWRENGVTSADVFNRQAQIGAASDELWEQARAMVMQAVERRHLPK
jgi:putative hydrolase of HD superfamily